MYTRRGKGCVIVVSLVDVERLQRAEDEADSSMLHDRLGDGDVSDYARHDQIVADLSE